MVLLNLNEGETIMYKKYEFCISVKCPMLVDNKCKVDADNCVCTAKQFHKWLNRNQFMLVTGHTWNIVCSTLTEMVQQTAAFSSAIATAQTPRNIVDSIVLPYCISMKELIFKYAKERKL